MNEAEPELELEEYVAMLTERRGECDVALFFDVRWILSDDPECYIKRVLIEAGAALATAWAGYGQWRGAGYDYDALWRLFVAAVAAPRAFDFPEPNQSLRVALLENIRRHDFARSLPSLTRAPAFAGHADVTFPTDMRTAVMRVIRWR